MGIDLRPTAFAILHSTLVLIKELQNENKTYKQQIGLMLFIEKTIT